MLISFCIVVYIYTYGEHIKYLSEHDENQRKLLIYKLPLTEQGAKLKTVRHFQLPSS